MSAEKKSREEVDRLFIEFAQKHSEVEAICEAGDFEEDFPVFYILIPGYKPNNGIEDEVSDLTIRVCRELGMNIEAMIYPISAKNIDGHLAHPRPVYRRKQNPPYKA